MHYVGIDLHKRYVTVCALDKSGEVVAEYRRLSNTAEAVLGFLERLKGPVAVALEATLHWAWLHDLLSGAGYEVKVAHPQQVKLICHARCKTDPVDAHKLADLLRTDLLPAIWVPDAETRAKRRLLRGRAFLVRARTRVKNRIQAYLAEQNLRVPVTDLFGKAGRQWLGVVALPEAVRLQVELLVELVEVLDERVKRLDREIRERVAVSPEAQRLMTVPGIGPYLALLIEAEIGTIERFRTSHELASYAGLVPSTRSSGGKTAHGGVGPAGSSWLKWALVEATQVLKRSPGPVRFHYERLVRAKGKQKATVAAARKLCCYLYWMLREGWSYEEWLERRERLEVRPVQTLASVA
ncbi:MAG: IS110 family transposase [Gemmatimonadales bacterium]|nr:IS110 family transposase [Gemmatimonadales bacterium]